MPDPLQFAYNNLAELEAAIRAEGVAIPLSDDISILNEPVRFGDAAVPNRMSIQPMEGCDGNADGAPSPLTVRRYMRFASGGAGLLWVEATAVVPEGRANPRQIMLHQGTFNAFRDMVSVMRTTAQNRAGLNPFLVLQMTHSGRYSRPGARPAPMIAHHSAVLDPRHKLPPDYPLVTDAYLDALQDKFVDTAKLARDAGFDAVDIKSCHRYLVAELHASYTRENSRYGGNLENRTRFLRETTAKIRDRVPGIQVTCQLNAFDAIPHPFGFGVDRADPEKPDLAEPLKLIGDLITLGVKGINITIGNPYSNPHVGRPYDYPVAGSEKPPIHPLRLVARFIDVVRVIQQAHPGLAVIGGGYSWLRQFYPQAAAGVLRNRWATIAGVGRNAFAYPEFARDIRDRGALDPLKVCVTCSSCTQIMRDGGRAGCVLKDEEVYGPIFREGRRNAEDLVKAQAARCRTCAAPTCRAGCPALVDIPGFIARYSAGDHEGAYRILRERNPLPELCALICPTTETCECRCIYKAIADAPVDISAIQLFVSRMARISGFKVEQAAEAPWRAAVVGGGPSGLACADGLARRGCRVTIFEKTAALGGTVRSLIPAHKIAFADVDGEIDFVIRGNPRIRVETGRALGHNLTPADLGAFNAVYLALGLGEGAPLFEPRPEGVLNAVDFLARVKQGTAGEMPAAVGVIGGGNTALDAAAAARALGARDVFVIYRRTLAEMPAWAAEYRKASEAGVNFMILSQPMGYRTEHGRLTGLDIARTALGEPDATGRRKPAVVPGSTCFMPCGLVIEAAGQAIPETLRRALPGIAFADDGYIRTAPGSRRTSDPRYFAGGDLTSGGSTAVQGIAEGRDAAEEIWKFLEQKVGKSEGSESRKA
ncbi:MAG: FAD-dependent oxidoreductase [Planctomycetota bacterium]